MTPLPLCQYSEWGRPCGEVATRTDGGYYCCDVHGCAAIEGSFCSTFDEPKDLPWATEVRAECEKGPEEDGPEGIAGDD